MFISSAFAQAAPAPSAGPEGMFSTLLLFGGMFAVMYFLMIRPQMKRQKEHKALVDALAKGDEVVTAGGMIGKVSKVGETYLHLDVGNGVEVQVQRTSVVQVLPRGTVK